MWSEDVWTVALRDTRIVVSTHAILADALSHGFVRMADLALLIFDEGCFNEDFAYFLG